MSAAFIERAGRENASANRKLAFYRVASVPCRAEWRGTGTQ
jgi:hypothetical protein